MKYVMVDKTDSIVSRAEFDNDVGIEKAKIYFIKMKRLPEKKFDEIWRVMSDKEWYEQYEVGHRKPSSSGYQWWKEENTNLDDF